MNIQIIIPLSFILFICCIKIGYVSRLNGKIALKLQENQMFCLFPIIEFQSSERRVVFGKCFGENGVQFYMFAQVLLAELATGSSCSPAAAVIDRPAPCLTHLLIHSELR